MKTTSFQPAERIKDIKPYFFDGLNKRINALKAKGLDIIRIDMGSPDLPPADFIIDALIESAKSPASHGYGPYGGTPEYRQAISSYYKKRFGVELDPLKETLGLIGSKEGLFDLSMVMLNPNDLVLMPDPGYPVYQSGTIITKANMYTLPLIRENGFLPDFDNIPSDIAKKAKILWLSYPNNPTTALASQGFFEKAVAFAREFNILIAHDAPYVDVCFDGYRAPSILQTPGAIDVAVEFNSLSKTYNMGGWRLGMAVGNPQVINMIHTYKSLVDTSHFTPVMHAGAIALTGSQEWLVQRNATYQERRDILVKALREAGFTLDNPVATIYIWAKLPDPYKDSDVFCTRMLEEAGVSTTPGNVYGEAGQGYIRISLGTPTHRIREAAERIVQWMKKIG